MSNYPFKSLFYFLQIRSIATKTLKPVATATELVSKSKTQKNRAEISSEKEQSAITLFKKHHFTDTQIAIIAKKTPQTLRLNVESILEPKLKFLNEIGFVGSLLPDLIVANLSILWQNLANKLIPNYEYLRESMKLDQATSVVLVRRAPRILTSDIRKILPPNIEFLFGEGVPMSSILKLLTLHPTRLLSTIGRIRYGVATVREYGVEPSGNMFIYAFCAFLSMSELNWKKKVGILKSLGWSDKDIASTMARFPACLGYSEVKLRRTFEFFVKTMDLKPEDMINNPVLFGYSLDKRTIPRCKVVMALKKKNLLEDFNMGVLLRMNEDKFTQKFILNHPAYSSSLWNLYRGAVPV